MEALLSASAPADEVATPRAAPRVRAVYVRALTLVIGLCASLPVITAAVRALHEGWQPVADRGIIATRSFDVFSSHMPLVGQYSFASTVTGKLTYSLGPMLYWLLAPAAHIGAPESFVLTMAVVNVGAILGAVALARRRGGLWLMVATAIGIALMCRSLAANNFYDIWNPSAGLFPLLLLVFVCWSLACGEYRLLPLAVLVASFCAQCEDSFVPASLGLMAVGLGGLALSRVQARRRRPPGERGGAWRWMLGALAVFAICWTPPLVDQLAHGGNLSLVVQAATERKSSLGPTVGLRAVIRTVGVTPWWLTRPSDPFVRKLDVRHSAGTLADLSTAVILGWLLLAIALAIRRRRLDVIAGSLTALVLCAAVWSIANATPTTPLLSATLGYTLWSATTVGMFVWLIALWSAFVLLGLGAALERTGSSLLRRARWRPATARAVGAGLAASVAVALAALAGGVGVAAGTPDEHAFEFAALKTINAHLGAVPRGHSVYLDARLDGLITPLRPEITYDLRRRGVRALGSGAYLRTGHWYELSEHHYDYIVWVYDYGHLPVRGARVIAVAHIRSGGRRHTVEVAISRAQSHRVIEATSTARSGALAHSVPPRDRSGAWSAPSELSGCALASGPRVAFPSEGPSSPTGPGAIVWASPPGCDGAAAPASRASVSVAALRASGRATAASTRSLGASAAVGLASVGGSLGRVVISAGLASLSGQAAVLQGRATGPIGSPALLAAQDVPPALTRAYLGDVAIATVAPGPLIAVRVERYFQHGFARARLIPIPPGGVTALTATMDYRSDVLLAWQQNGSIYAHMLRASGRPEPTQRLGPSGPEPQLRALVSDNNHGMVTWSTTSPSAHSAPRTHVYVDLSAVGVRFRTPRLLASFADPARVGSRSGSLELVRLSTENVILAWTDAERGHYVVRTVPAVFAASRPGALVSDPRGQAVLADLAPGPAREAVLLWSAAPLGSALDPGQTELWAARAVLEPHDHPAVSAREQIAPAGANLDPSVAVDPASDRAVAAWLTQGSRPSVHYASSLGAAGYRPSSLAGAITSPSGGTHWLRITLAAAAAVALALLALLIWRRRGRRHA